MYYIGKITNTHGIKGEVKILSNIKHKDLVFKKNNKLIIDDIELVINSYRVHKNYDLVTFKDINDINDVLKYKGKKVYFNEKLDVLFDEDYIGLEVYTDKYVGIIKDIINNGANDIFVIYNEDKKYYIPNVSAFIKKIDFKEKRIYINTIEGLIDEN